MSRVVKRLWWPSVVFLVFLISMLASKDMLVQFGLEAFSQTQKVFVYIIQIGIWLSAAHFLNRILVLFVWEGLVERALGSPVPRLVKDVVAIIIYLIAVTGIIGFVFHKDVTAVWAASGVVGIVLGLALQSIILDIFTGLSINIDRQFKIGDWIRIHKSIDEDGLIGKIIEINWRTTRLETEIKNTLILPNRVLGTSVVTNLYGPSLESRHETAFRLDFSVPTERAKRILLAGAKAVMGQKGLLEDPAPSVVVSKITDHDVEYKVRYWFTPWTDMAPGMARDFVTESILEHLKKADIGPAYPRQDVFYTEMPKRDYDTRTPEARRELLGRIEMFEELKPDELNSLADRMTQRSFKAGDKLIKQGEAGDSMFILSEGLLQAYIRTNDSPDSEIRVGQIVPGQFFGEMSLLTGEPRSATIVAATEAVAHEITKENMNGLLERRPAIAETVSKVVAERKIMNSQAMAAASEEERVEQTKSLAQQIMSKMKTFFKGVF